MATKPAKKKTRTASKATAAPRKSAATNQALTAAQLHAVIKQVVETKLSGDYAAENAAASALAATEQRAGPAHLLRTAAEARAVAQNQVLVDSVRQLETLAARLKAHQ